MGTYMKDNECATRDVPLRSDDEAKDGVRRAYNEKYLRLALRDRYPSSIEGE